MAKSELAMAPMHRICKKAGAERVSESAARELSKILEEVGIEIAKLAMEFAEHAGRKTIKAKDISKAASKVLKK